MYYHFRHFYKNYYLKHFSTKSKNSNDFNFECFLIIKDLNYSFVPLNLLFIFQYFIVKYQIKYFFNKWYQFNLLRINNYYSVHELYTYFWMFSVQWLLVIISIHLFFILNLQSHYFFDYILIGIIHLFFLIKYIFLQILLGFYHWVHFIFLNYKNKNYLILWVLTIFCLNLCNHILS